MKKILILLLIALTIITALAWINKDRGRDQIDPNIPDLTLTTHDGETINLSELDDTPKIINTWASWCSFCKEELKDFALLQEEFGEKIQVIAINRAESLDTADQFASSLEVKGRLLLLLDPQDSFYKSIDGFSMPETIFIDSSGKIKIHKRGFMEIEEMREKTEQII